MSGPSAQASENRVRAHYGRYQRAHAAIADLAAQGRDVDRLTPEDLVAYDQLHTCGPEGTRATIAALNADAGFHVLDVGSGLGGPARMLNSACGCRVTGVDLTPDFVDIATDFTRRTRQHNEVEFLVGSATSLPFDDRAFDAAWHIHMSMNIADKAAMYRQIARVLKPGGRFVVFDPIRGPRGDVLYPVPWSATPDLSFLLPVDDITEVIVSAGFAVEFISDVTSDGLRWFGEIDRVRAAQPGRATPTQVDPRMAEMSNNHRANLTSGAVALWRAAFVRKS